MTSLNCWRAQAAVGVACNVQMQQPARAVEHCDEYVNLPEGRRDRDEKIAGDDRLRVVTEKRRPALVAARAARHRLTHVLANGTRRNSQPEFEQEFVGDAFLAPRRIGGCHATNQLAKLGRNARATWPRLVSPEKPPSCAVPAHDSLRSNQRHTRAPIAHARQDCQADPRCRIDTPRCDAALLEKRKLPSQDEVFGRSG